MKTESTAYEKVLSYNKITKKLHANKYNILLKKLKKYDPNKKLTVVDIGSGPCQVFARLKAVFPKIEYLAIEPMKEFCDIANKNFGHFDGFSIKKASAQTILDHIEKTDIIVSFDSLEHIPLNIRNHVLEKIANITFNDLFINVPNEIGPAILFKNYGSLLMRYVRHKEYTHLETWLATLYRIDRLPVHIDSHKGFDWRALYNSLRFYFKTELYTSPTQFIPRCLSPSIFFHCTKMT